MHRGVGAAISLCSSGNQRPGVPWVCPLTHLACTSSLSHHPRGQRGPTFLFLHPITPAVSSATHHSNATDTFHLRNPNPLQILTNQSRKQHSLSSAKLAAVVSPNFAWKNLSVFCHFLTSKCCFLGTFQKAHVHVSSTESCFPGSLPTLSVLG